MGLAKGDMIGMRIAQLHTAQVTGTGSKETS